MSHEARLALGGFAAVLLVAALDAVACWRSWWASPLCLPETWCR